MLTETGVGGGATGIRTLETVSRLHTFQACAFDHSATAPLWRGVAWGVCKLQEGNRLFSKQSTHVTSGLPQDAETHT